MDLRAGERLTIARKRRGMTQAELVQAAGKPVTLFTLREFEMGRRDIRVEGLVAICRALDITTQEILGA